MSLRVKSVLSTQVSLEEAFASEGVQFGFGLFETLALFVKASGEWEIRNLEGHMVRLSHSAQKLDITLPKPHIIKTALEAYAVELAQSLNCNQSEEQHWAVKLTVLKNADGADCMLSHRINPYATKDYPLKKLQGLRLIQSELVRDEKSECTYHKTTNYLTNLLEKRNAVVRGYDDCFFLNRQGYISETTVANLFFIKGDHLLTPALQCGLLPGTIRALILKQAKANGRRVEEVKLSPDDLCHFDGAVACNALMGVMPVATMGEHHFKASTQLAEDLIKWVEEALCEQQ